MKGKAMTLLTKLQLDAFNWLKQQANQRCTVDTVSGIQKSSLTQLCKKGLVARIQGERTSKSYRPDFFQVIIK